MEMEKDSGREKQISRHQRASKGYKDAIKEAEASLTMIENRLVENTLLLPNDIHPEVPIGPYEKAKVIYQYKSEDIKVGNKSDHLKLCKSLNLADFEDAGKVTGERFVYLKNEGALLELALINWGMEYLINKGFTPIITPDMVKTQIIESTGFNPRDDSSTFLIRSNI